MIKVICYGKEYEYKNKQEALVFFLDCYKSCDPASSEAARYATIISKLISNEQPITDEEV